MHATVWTEIFLCHSIKISISLERLNLLSPFFHHCKVKSMTYLEIDIIYSRFFLFLKYSFHSMIAFFVLFCFVFCLFFWLIRYIALLLLAVLYFNIILEIECNLLYYVIIIVHDLVTQNLHPPGKSTHVHCGLWPHRIWYPHYLYIALFLLLFPHYAWNVTSYKMLQLMDFGPAIPSGVFTSAISFSIWRADFQNLLHPLLHVTHLQLRSQQKCPFSTQKLLQMDNVDTNLE